MYKFRNFRLYNYWGFISDLFKSMDFTEIHKDIPRNPQECYINPRIYMDILKIYQNNQNYNAQQIF